MTCGLMIAEEYNIHNRVDGNRFLSLIADSRCFSNQFQSSAFPGIGAFLKLLNN